jgi:predicted transcriptional regulator
MVTADGVGASHALVARLDKLAARRGYDLTYSVRWALTEREKAALRLVPEQAWQIAIDSRGEVRERRADEACADSSCAHRRCWIEEAHVTELTGLLRAGPHGDQLKAWPQAMRVFARRERPHPGAQLKWWASSICHHPLPGPSSSFSRTHRALGSQSQNSSSASASRRACALDSISPSSTLPRRTMALMMSPLRTPAPFSCMTSATIRYVSICSYRLCLSASDILASKEAYSAARYVM